MCIYTHIYIYIIYICTHIHMYDTSNARIAACISGADVSEIDRYICVYIHMCIYTHIYLYNIYTHTYIN